VLVIKDADFVNSFLLFGTPARLLLVSTGNISNSRLEALLVGNLESLDAALGESALVEFGSAAIIVRG
jgi:predicted nuclease of predicted toxin-antitoxin system